MQKRSINRTVWKNASLLKLANAWFKRLYKRKFMCYEQASLWWWFVWRWQSIRESCITALIAGDYQFSPMQCYRFVGHTEICWDYPDRLVLSLLLQLIKSTFKQVIPSSCLHLDGPSAVKTAILQVKKNLKNTPYQYMIRADVKGYYASINRKILMQQLHKHYDDPRLLHYLDAIVNHSIDDGGVVYTPSIGILMRCSLSLFFGALYLAELDRSFEKIKDCFYVRYMDDIVILTRTKRQYLRAKRRLQKHLQQLHLTLAPTKTRMGLLGNKSFHFLGVTFATSQSLQEKFQEPTMTRHPRSCRRAIERVNLMIDDAVPAVKIQRYLVSWSTWWKCTMNQGTKQQLLAM